MIGGGYGYGSVFGNGYYPPVYAPYFGGNPYAPPLGLSPAEQLLLRSVLESRSAGIDAGKPASLGPEPAPQRRPPAGARPLAAFDARAAGQEHPLPGAGDVYLHRLKFLNAYERYKVAVNAANDRPEPYFRLGYALAAVGSFDSAVKYIKQGLDLDPPGPRTANGWRRSSATTIGSPS